MPQFLLSVHHGYDGDLPTDPEEIQPVYEAVDAFNKLVMAAGAWVFAGGLQDISAAATVDATSGGEPVVTDGPYAESKEYLGGFWIIEAADMEAALQWAREGSAACRGKVEVRPFQEEPS